MEPFTFSQSSLQDYADCPRRFQLRYIEQLAWPAVESEPLLENERRQQEGQFFHRLVQQYLIGLPEEKLRRLAASPDLSRWWDNFIAHRSSLIIPHSSFPELTLSAPLGEHRLLAKYDLVTVQEDGKAMIYDWKTYHNRPRDEWMAARWQTRVYRALLVQAGASLHGGNPVVSDQVEMIYWYANFPAEAAHFPYNATQFKHDWDSLLKMVGEIASATAFEMTGDEKKCAYCPYRSYCERGVEAGEGGEIENELAGADFHFEQIQEIAF